MRLAYLTDVLFCFVLFFWGGGGGRVGWGWKCLCFPLRHVRIIVRMLQQHNAPFKLVSSHKKVTEKDVFNPVCILFPICRSLHFIQTVILYMRSHGVFNISENFSPYMYLISRVSPSSCSDPPMRLRWSLRLLSSSDVFTHCRTDSVLQ